MLLSLGNLGIITALILFSHSYDTVFKNKRQLYIIGLTIISLFVAVYIINYNRDNIPDFKTPGIFAEGLNLSVFIIGLEIFWINIRKKEEKRKVVYITLLLAVFITFIINNFYLSGTASSFAIPLYVELLSTFAILLIGFAGWFEINIKDEYHDDKTYSLFFVSRIERIIPVLSIIILMTVFYFNSHKLNEMLIRTSIIIFIPFILFLLVYEWYSFRSEDALLSILSLSPSGILITDRNFEKIYFINDSLKRIFKSSDIPPDLVISRNTSDELKERIREFIPAGKSLENAETVFIRPGGTAFNAQCRIVPAKYYSYDVVISWIADITERKKYENLILKQKYSAEIASLHKTELLDNLSNRIQSGYVTMKPHPEGWPDFVLTGMNKRGLELFNYSEDLTGRMLRELFPDFEEKIINRFFKVLNTGIAIKRELNFKKLGKVFTVLMFKASDDEVACLIDDITEVKARERELVERERELRSLLGNYPGMAYRCRNEIEWPLLFVSPGAYDLCGYTLDELLEGGKINWGDIVFPDDREKVWHNVQVALENRDTFNVEYRIRSKEGHIKRVWAKGSGIYDDNGDFMFIEGFIVDITKEREAEAVLRENDLKEKEIEKAKAIRQMAGGIAHDLNNRLMGMASYTSLIDMKVKDINIKKYTDGIQESIKKSTELIDDLLLFARQADINRNIFSVHDMLQDMIIRLSEDLPREITVNTSFMAASDSINGDLRQICRSIYDIAINARDAMIDGGIISITTENRKIEEGNLLDLTEGDADRLFIVIKISDTGPGIEKENLGRIFDPFFTTKPVGKGRGLGLSAVYGTIQSHRGAITVDSKPGKGTTFSIYLPVA
jgi:PAS domain S-box-containing protein